MMGVGVGGAGGASEELVQCRIEGWCLGGGVVVVLAACCLVIH